MLRKELVNDLPVIKASDNYPLSEAEKQRILSHFLRSERQQGVTVWDQNSTHPINIKDSRGIAHKYTISFPRKLVYRSKQIADTNKTVARYDLVGDKIGEGACGGVYDVLATLSHLRNGEMHVNTNKEYVIKLQDHWNGASRVLAEDAINEGKKNKLPHLGGKNITLRKNREGDVIESYLVTLKLKDQVLEEVLQKDYAVNPGLETEERFQLTINLLRAYIEQIADHNVIHRDIKSLNTMVDMKKLLVNLFDLGFAIYSHEVETQKR